MPPKISVFITSYNQKYYLIQAIESVLAQTLSPYEIIIVDDCSTDGSQETILQYANKYPNLIKPFCHTQNIGIAKNKAFAQKHASGDWLTYLDGDDLFLPDKLEKEWATLEEQSAAKVVFSNFYVIDEAGRRVSLWADGVTPPSGNIFLQVFARSFPGNTIFRNELVSYDCLKDIGFYDESRITHEDWDIKIRLSKRYQVAYCDVPLVEYRRHSQGISKLSKDALLFKEMREVYDKNRHLLEDVPKSEKALVYNALRKLFSRRTTKIIKGAIREENRRQAFRYYLEYWKWMPPQVKLKNLMFLLLPRTAT